MSTLSLLLLSLVLACIKIEAFVVRPPHHVITTSQLHSTKSNKAEDGGPKSFAVGTIVEFSEKSRQHMGTITAVTSKTGGGSRYTVQDLEGKQFSIADKAVSYAVPAPTNDFAFQKLISEMTKAQTISEPKLRQELDISPELMEMAWEEAVETMDGGTVTPKMLINLVHSQVGSAVDQYKAWRLMQLQMGHVFFRSLKESGRVVAFKAKARKAVDDAKRAFCNQDHEEDEDAEELCFAI